jgi:hypothetical protein
MTDHVVRLYAAAIAVVAFFLFWAMVAARPWAPTGESDPRLTALERREAQLVRDTRRVNRLVKRRFAVHARRLARRKRAIARRERENAALSASAPAGGAAPSGGGGSVAPAASAPAVSVTAAPPVTTTSSS